VLLLLVVGGLLAFLLTRPDTVLVPTVLGKDQVEARTILEDAGFEVAVKSEPNDAPKGTVLEQDPRAGERADEGSTVTISVSGGLGTVVVPPVTGDRASEARKALKDAGFRVKVRERPSSVVRAGLAIETQPPAGTELERGRTVTLLVSSGARLVDVPPLIGEQQDLAESQLRSAGLIPDVEQRDSDAPEGEVIAQDPPGGSSVKTNTTVTIVVSTGAGTAIVPNVVGKSRDDARADLRTAGLDVLVVSRTTSDENEDGIVLDQSPSAGTRLQRGESVTVFVGRFEAPPPTTTTTTPP
jgi:serine/threonine-protein kinase